ncbi:MAG: endolytic transglycosylase MltG [Candidatus Paceibacterota bacterium]
MKKFLYVYVILAGVLILFFWFLGNFVFSNYSSSDRGVYPHTNGIGVGVYFEVEKDQSVKQIAQNLFDEGIINSKSSFLFYSYLSGNFSSLKPGLYPLSKSTGVSDVVRALISGPKEIKVVIYPGMTLKEIEDKLFDSKVIKEKDLGRISLNELTKEYPFLSDAKTLEGFLMPDTYDFHSFSDSKDVVKVFLDNFEKKTKNVLTGKDILKIVTKASLIEKEVVFKEDKKIVSGIIDKRLSLGMAIQIDASLIYGICQGRFLDCSKLASSDFKDDFEYNTYTRQGLPPTPISNPSLESIEASVSPSPTNYLYYLSDSKTKKTIFSVTLEEHNNNRWKYLGL